MFKFILPYPAEGKGMASSGVNQVLAFGTGCAGSEFKTAPYPRKTATVAAAQVLHLPTSPHQSRR